MSVATTTCAGPPYLIDDPEPTDTGHWEIYGVTAGEGHNSDLDEDLGFHLNYGPVKGVKLTAALPRFNAAARMETRLHLRGN